MATEEGAIEKAHTSANRLFLLSETIYTFQMGYPHINRTNVEGSHRFSPSSSDRSDRECTPATS